jgi:predicted transposase YdaD
VEVQFQKDTALHSRLFAEIFIYTLQNGVQCKWKAVVIYPNRAAEQDETNAFETLLNSSSVIRV